MGYSRIAEVSLKNIRGFRDFKLSFPMTGDPSRTVIIGKNGTGKTTLLRAITLGLCDIGDAGALTAEPIGSLLRQSSERAEIAVNFGIAGRNIRGQRIKDTNSVVISNKLGKDFISIVSSLATQFGSAEPTLAEAPAAYTVGTSFVCGYGVGRANIGVESELNVTSYRMRDAVYGLFSYRQSLLNPELTLRRLRDYFQEEDPTTYDKILLRIQESIGLTSEDRIGIRPGGGIIISGSSIGNKETIPIEAWADGYRLTFNWLVDLYGWALRAGAIHKDGRIAHGIVLIDEIEQHLHPSLQTEILPRLSKALPDVQIIATTHSPLVPLGVAPHNVVSLEQEGDEIVQKSVPDYTGYSVEDMLVDDDLFDTPNVYRPETNDKLTQYRQLSQIPAETRTPGQSQQLQQLSRELIQLQLPEARQPTVDPALQAILEKHNLL